MNSNDTQIGGDHYKKLKIQSWDFIAANDLDFFQGNIIKYVVRDKGNQLQDLMKAKHYLEKYMELIATELDCADCKEEVRGALGTL